MCLLLEVCEAFIWAAISEAGNSNSGSSLSVAVLMGASSIIALDALEETFKVHDIYRID